MADPIDSDYHGNFKQPEREASFDASDCWANHLTHEEQSCILIGLDRLSSFRDTGWAVFAEDLHEKLSKRWASSPNDPSSATASTARPERKGNDE